MPGYYNTAYGITATFTPIRNLYLSYGLYDGNIANHVQTGLHGAPNFNGYYFHIGEGGGAWEIAGLPGSFGIGGWHQTGQLAPTSEYNHRKWSVRFLSIRFATILARASKHR